MFNSLVESRHIITHDREEQRQERNGMNSGVQEHCNITQHNIIHNQT